MAIKNALGVVLGRFFYPLNKALRRAIFTNRIFRTIIFCLIVGCSVVAYGAEEKTALSPQLQVSNLPQGLAQQPNAKLLRCSPFATAKPVQVASVYDGDTLTLSDGRKIRLLGINTSEVASRGSPDQPFSLEAKRAVQSFIKQSKQIQLLTDIKIKDHYGRWLGHIYNETGDSLNQSLLQQGLAYHVVIPPNLSLAECLGQTAQEAQKYQRGLWSAKGIPPIKAKLVKSGGYQRVQGRVTSIGTAKHWRIKLDNAVTVMVYSEHQYRFTKGWLQHLESKRVEVRGWVYQSKGQWRIKLETPYGITIY